MKRPLLNARLKINACIEDIDYKTPRGIDKSVILRNTWTVSPICADKRHRCDEMDR